MLLVAALGDNVVSLHDARHALLADADAPLAQVAVDAAAAVDPLALLVAELDVLEDLVVALGAG